MPSPPPLLPLLPRASSPGDAAEGVSGSFVLFSRRRHCVCPHSASSTSHPALRILCRGEQRARGRLSLLPRSLGCLALRTSCRARITVPFFEFLSLCRCQRMVVSLPQWLCSCVSSLPNTRASRDAASTRTPRQKPRWCTGTPRGRGGGRVRCFSLLPSSPPPLSPSLYISFFFSCVRVCLCHSLQPSPSVFSLDFSSPLFACLSGLSRVSQGRAHCRCQEVALCAMWRPPVSPCMWVCRSRHVCKALSVCFPLHPPF